MKKIIILDYRTSEVHIYDYNDQEITEFLHDKGHGGFNVDYMIVEELNIKIH